MSSSIAPLRDSAIPRDYYFELIEGSRWLRAEQALARTEWYESLADPNKDTLLFEFEMLLKGLVCLGNPVNHTGPQRRGEPVAAREFTNEMGVVRDVLRRILEVGRSLCEESERGRVFQRYLESVIAQDQARFRLVKRSLSQDTPKQSIHLLLESLQNLYEVVDGLMLLSHISYRRFTSVIQLAQREIQRSTYFNPLAALEFRTEFDKIEAPRLLAMITAIKSDPAKRVTVLSILSLLRLMRYLDVIGRMKQDEHNVGVLIGWLAVLRSDLRALSVFLKRDTATWISSGFGGRFEGAPPEAIHEKYDHLLGEFQSLKSLRELLSSVGDQLRLEQRKVYEQQFPSMEAVEDSARFWDEVQPATISLRSFIQNALVLIVREFDHGLTGEKLYGPSFVSSSAHSNRLRRDVWMFQMILRAFIEKTKGSAADADRWTGLNTFHFVRQFVVYFKSMGYQLLRYSDYERFDKFMSLVDRLREGDVLEVQRVSHIVEECNDFARYLQETFNAVSKRDELVDVPFDRKEAARTLKLFLRR